jgi:hypothetical protein
MRPPLSTWHLSVQVVYNILLQLVACCFFCIVIAVSFVILYPVRFVSAMHRNITTVAGSTFFDEESGTAKPPKVTIQSRCTELFGTLRIHLLLNLY